MSSSLPHILSKWKALASGVHPSSRFTVVLGNESGDLDSVVGAICLAWVLNEHPTLDMKPAVPALNFDPRDLPLRVDVHRFLEKHGVPAECLLTADPKARSSIPADSFVDISREEVSVVLFDHNVLLDCHSSCGSRVVGVVDHHKNEQQYLETTSRLRIIKEVGSASTLVARMCEESGMRFPFPTFLAGPIVIDCENFDPSRRRATPDDVATYEWLKTQCISGSELPDPTALFTQLKAWRTEIFSLSVQENLRKDYKSFSGKSLFVGVSSIPCSRVRFVEHYPEYTKPVLEFIRQRQVRAFFITFAGTDNGGHQRDVIAVGTPQDIQPFLDMAQSDNLFNKVEEHSAEGFLFTSYSISDTTLSRKKLAPLLRSIL